MSVMARSQTWEDASSPAVERLNRRFEKDWRAATSGSRPNLEAYIPTDGSDVNGLRLALLRTEMALRFEAGERVEIDEYLRRYPNLDQDSLVALIYEQFCLLEEAGEDPAPAEYQARFPHVADRLKRLLDIHDLVSLGDTTALHVPSAHHVAYPEAGQTIGGFHLVEELGRGAFARVFRAEERQLADRPVALKVARSGSREPQTLARLQHTHIVPVHSYRIDTVTGLHLLCMPYVGGVTLADLLADPRMAQARTGADLLAALDERITPKSRFAGRSMGREALAGRSYVRAIAWWGARMAEALQHAHERGVLHRDIKPSNVLVTNDGLPMLLDFNLAWETRIDDPEVEPGALGGTLAYMAPEHLEALADGLAGRDHIDGRADIYALGVLLYEAMGQRPFPPPGDALSITEALLRTAEQRRSGPPAMKDLAA